MSPAIAAKMTKDILRTVHISGALCYASMRLFRALIDANGYFERKPTGRSYDALPLLSGRQVLV